MIVNSKPLQRKSWAEKNKNKQQWFKDNGDYLISKSTFGDSGVTGNRVTKLKALYEIYNSKFPSIWFIHVTDTFSTGKNVVWPAKIRPMNILRPNIEFLRGQYPKRPFNYQVVVKGEDGYNSFIEGKKKEVYKNISQIFINTVNEEATKAEEQSIPMDTGVDSKEVEMPEEIVNKFITTFKNTLAVQAQTDIDLIMEDQHIKEKLTDMLKDWLIAGEAYSYKNVLRDEVVYERVSPLELDYDKSPHVKYVQDSDWVVRRMLLTVSDVVDRFYDSLKPKDIDSLEDGSYTQSPVQFQNYLRESATESDKVSVYHYCWRSMEKIGYLTYPNPITGKLENDIVNEDYPINKELGETVEWYWRTRWMEGYRLSDKTHVEMGYIRFAPSMMNNFSKTIGPYNGVSFSNTHAENISVLKLGLPFQIMYVIANFSMERTLAKSRGKVVLLDQAVIPKGEGWTDEKFFQMSEAQGWGLINRNQLGVDKSYNQYQVLDLGLFDHIKNLIEIMDFCKRQYDEQLGISRQAKAQVTSSDSVGGTQTAVYQSSIITEMIFAEFDSFVRTELEGLLDCSQISNIHGKRSSWVSGEGRTQLLDIMPEEYCYSQMGIMMSDSTKDNDALNRIRQHAQAFAQNGAPPSAIVAVETATNIATLKTFLLSIEAKQQQIEQQSAESAQEAKMSEIQLSQQFAEYNALLDSQKMHEEYNRKEDLVLIQGDINMALQSALPQPSEGSDGSAEALMNYTNTREKIELDNDRKQTELAHKIQLGKDKEKRNAAMDNHKKKIMDKDSALKADIAKKSLEIKKKQANRPKG